MYARMSTGWVMDRRVLGPTPRITGWNRRRSPPVMVRVHALVKRRLFAMFSAQFRSVH